MDYEQERKIKAMAAEQNQCGAAMGLDPRGEIGYKPERQYLRGRLREQYDRCSKEARKSNRIEELLGLLDRNPEVARILELLEELQ